MTTVDKIEIEKFSKLAKDWWNPNGKFKPLHMFNPCRIEFNEDDICYACRSVEEKWNGKIDWGEREKELIDLCEKYKNFKGPYNCIVGGSGGKDSSFQSHILKYKYGMRPLTVTWAPHIYTDIGWKNARNYQNTETVFFLS